MSVQIQSGSPNGAIQSPHDPGSASQTANSPATQATVVDQFLSAGGGDLFSVLRSAAQSQPAVSPKKKKKGGLFGKIGGFFKKVGQGIGNAFTKVGKFFLKFGPIIFGVMCLIPGLNVVGMVGLAAIAAYKAIKEKDFLGAVLTIAGAVTGGAAGALGSAASAAMQVASKVAQYARMAQQAFKAIQAAQDGNWLGALSAAAGAAGGIAGGIGTGAEKLASNLEQVSTWAKRAETASRAWGAAKNGDVFGAIGIGASLAGDVSKNAELKDAFARVAKGAQGARGVQAALQSNDYMAAALIFAQTGGQVTEGGDKELFKKAETSIQAISIASDAIQSKDWARAGAVLTAGGSAWVGSDETRGRLLVAAKALGTAGKAYARAETGYYRDAVALLGQSILLWKSLEADGESEVRREWTESRERLESSTHPGVVSQQAA